MLVKEAVTKMTHNVFRPGDVVDYYR